MGIRHLSPVRINWVFRPFWLTERPCRSYFIPRFDTFFKFDWSRAGCTRARWPKRRTPGIARTWLQRPADVQGPDGAYLDRNFGGHGGEGNHFPRLRPLPG